jgi:hypothetical protein
LHSGRLTRQPWNCPDKININQAKELDFLAIFLGKQPRQPLIATSALWLFSVEDGTLPGNLR